MASSSTPLPQPASLDDKLKEFDNVPLFMKSLPSEGGDDTLVNAIQSLIYEGHPDEIAQNFKTQGNDYFKGKRYREAMGFYTQGLEAKPTDPVLSEALLCNRAACNLELQNYGSVLKDCSEALQLNPKSSKAYYRSSLALLALERLEQVLDCCDRCLQFDPDNKGVIGVRDRAVAAKAKKDRKEAERLEKIRLEKELKRRMNLAFQVTKPLVRNIIPVAKPPGPPDNDSYEPHFDPEDPTGQTLIFPVFFLYPQYATSDVIPQFVETTTFAAHLSVMFPTSAPPPDWDKKREYTDGKLIVYAMTARKRLLKVGKKMTLADVCKAAKGKEGEPKDGLELKDGCLTFVVLPKGDVEQKWIDDFKKTRDS
ncbi:hypothetical protein HWV62_22171 [Athelia sp. TMB]|nr:hypothetical protein HWV62_22171 [Athelia sp. TMB]